MNSCCNSTGAFASAASMRAARACRDRRDKFIGGCLALALGYTFGMVLVAAWAVMTE